MKKPILVAILISLLVIGGIFAISTLRSQTLQDLIPVLSADKGEVQDDNNAQNDDDVTDKNSQDNNTDVDVDVDVDGDINGENNKPNLKPNTSTGGEIVTDTKDNSDEVNNLYAESVGFVFDLAMTYHFEYLPEFNRKETATDSLAYLDYVFMTKKAAYAEIGYIEKEDVDEIVSTFFAIDNIEHLSSRDWIFDGEVYAKGTPKNYGTLPIYGIESIEISEINLSDLSTISSTGVETDNVENVENPVNNPVNQANDGVNNVESPVENPNPSEKVTLYTVTLYQYIFPEFETVSPANFIASNSQEYSAPMSAVISAYGTQLINGEISVLGAIRTMIIEGNTEDFTLDEVKQVIEFTYSETGEIVFYSNTFSPME